MSGVLAPPPDDSLEWLPNCRRDNLPPAGTGGRRIWIRTRRSGVLASWGHLAEWGHVTHWCFRP